MTDAEAVRAHYRAALARRMPTAPEAVQRRLMVTLASLPPAEAAADEPAPVERALRPRSKPPLTPLAQLNQHIGQRTRPAGTARPELRSAQAFHDSWARLCAEDEVAQAVQRGPEAAGPLNSHMLVLRTLSLLSELSPDYLHRFMVHTDTLLWLDEASARPKPAAAAKARKAR
ncbi:DUF2894 domain-containing protein [Hydrogenophaga sp. PML113]|uniref:DUF2894 domain-containing protein n=1 Tax=Hydrogenophaga sp. PML113 TaxID=1899350 RepID=UPI000878302D|nr:DUF2894 domain-containing protein [Hydrogenophaga sp. PML113]